MIHKVILSIFLLVSLSGCNEPTIDTSTEETMKSSIQKVKESLPANKQEEFDKSIKTLMFSQIDMKNIFANAFAGQAMDKDKMLNDMKKSLSGKTGLEVIELAKNLKVKRAKEEEVKRTKREEAKRDYEIAELEALQTKKRLYGKNKEKLANFKVISSTFKQELRNKYSSRLQPIIELTVKNGTKIPVSRAYFKGTLQSEGRAIPWLVETFNYEISGGIEPNETKTWSLAPNMFSEWGKVDSPKDAIFTVEVEQLDGVNGKRFLSVRDFSDKDKERLAELEKKYK